jgi:hypothetical protein
MNLKNRVKLKIINKLKAPPLEGLPAGEAGFGEARICL